MNKITLFSFLLIFSINLNSQEIGSQFFKDFPFGKPHAEAAEQIQDFAPMIGICDCRSSQRHPQDGFKDTIDMAWQFKYILNGTAIQDESFKSDGSSTTSIRQFNQDSLKWYVTFFASNSPSPSPTTWAGGKEENGNIVLYAEQKAPNGMEGFSRLTFYDISEEGFSWIGEWVDKALTFTYPFWWIGCRKRRE